MNKNDFTIRLEREEDYREVENLVREAFWNIYRPGCLEHYVIHVLRKDPAFVKELDFVLTMGPIGIVPDLKRLGYGKKILDYSLEKATSMGFGAVLFEGNIGFYGKSGFDYARNFDIRYHDLPEGEDDSFFLCRELIPGYLEGVSGVYQTPPGYYVDIQEAEEFDKTFPYKEKMKLPGQIFQA